MLFNSLPFLIFAAVFFSIWPLVRGSSNARWGYLTVASFIFYGWWDWRFIFLLLASGCLDFFAALGMRRFPARKKLILALSVVGNVTALALFKYITFLTTNLNSLLSTFGLSGGLPVIEAALPVGISFYTFQSMSYTIDVYRGKMQPTPNPLHFFAYLAMFPQLVAGPIIRAADLLPQLMERPQPTEEQRWAGTRLITFGFFKKVVIADNLAPAINFAFGQGAVEPSAPYWWLVVTMFAFQIYYDFSGYSDIARGLANWMGYDFKLNFDHPYTATGFRDFWGRWHISLSTWFRDYLYIPLGGSRLGPARAYLFMWVTMLVSGLWHGAAWTFVIWGGLNALYLSFERITKWPKHMLKIPGGRFAATFIVLVLVWIGWVFFRAESLQQALDILAVMFDPSLLSIPRLNQLFVKALPFLLIASLSEGFFLLRLNKIRLLHSRAAGLVEPIFIALLLAACVYLRGPGSAFIYFQF